VADDFRAALEENFAGLDFDVVFESINYLDAPNHESWTPQWGRVEDTMEFAVARVLTGETLDAQLVLDEANEEIQGYLDEYWDSQ
jgi:multiple sugar transport system substrate-binding protein